MGRGFKQSTVSKATAAAAEQVHGDHGDKSIRIRGLILTAVGTVVVTLLDGLTQLCKFNMVAGVAMVLPITEGSMGEHWFRCSLGANLNIALSTTVQVDGVVFYDDNTP